MTRAGTALAAAFAVVALAAGCTSEAEPEPPLPTDDRPFGPAPDYEEHNTSLMSAASDKDIEALCVDLETALHDHGYLTWPESSDEPGEDWCSFVVRHPTQGELFAYFPSGLGAAIPTRVHAWSDEDGSNIGYFEPSALLNAAGSSAALEEYGDALTAYGETLAADLEAVASEAAGGGTPESGAPGVATYTEIPAELPFDELTESLRQAAEGSGLRLIDEIVYEAGRTGRTFVFAVEGRDSALYGGLYETSPSIGVANPVHLHVWEDDSGNGVISYFDPMPLFGAVGSEFADAGTEASTIVSDVVWAAALPQ